MLTSSSERSESEAWAFFLFLLRVRWRGFLVGAEGAAEVARAEREAAILASESESRSESESEDEDELSEEELVIKQSKQVRPQTGITPVSG